MEYKALLELAEKLRPLTEEEQKAVLNKTDGLIDGILLSRSIRLSTAPQTPAPQPAT